MAQPTTPALSPKTRPLLTLELLPFFSHLLATFPCFHLDCPAHHSFLHVKILPSFYVSYKCDVFPDLSALCSVSVRSIMLCCLNKYILKPLGLSPVTSHSHHSLMWVQQLSSVFFSKSDSGTPAACIYQLCYLSIVCFQWWGGEREGLSGGCTPLLNCLKQEPSCHFHSHSCWWELNQSIPDDL